MDMGQQCALIDQNAKHILGCIKSSLTSGLRDVILPNYPNYSALMRHHLGYSVQYMKNIDLLELVQRRATKMIRVLGHLSYEDRLKELFSLGKRRLQRHPIVASQYLKGALHKRFANTVERLEQEGTVLNHKRLELD